jgi:tetratricopeptide (TPR) repeat protein
MYDAGIALLEASLEAAGPEAPATARIDGLIALGEVLRHKGEFASARSRLHEAVESAAKTNDHVRVAIANASLGWVAFRVGESALARTLWEKAKSVGEPPASGILAGMGLGNLAWMEGKVDDGIRLLKDAVERARELGLVSLEIRALTNLAGAYNQACRYSDSRHALQRVRVLSSTLGDRVGLLAALNNSACLDQEEGKHREARSEFLEIEALASMNGLLYYQILGYLGSAESDAALSNLDDARASAEEGRRLAFSTPRKDAQIWAERIIAEIEIAAGHRREAECRLLAAIDLARAIGEKRELARLEKMKEAIASMRPDV